MKQLLAGVVAGLAVAAASAFDHPAPLFGTGEMPVEMPITLADFSLRGPVSEVHEVIVRATYGNGWSWREKAFDMTLKFNARGLLVQQYIIRANDHDRITIKYDGQNRLEQINTEKMSWKPASELMTPGVPWQETTRFTYPGPGQMSGATRAPHGGRGCWRLVRTGEFLLTRNNCDDDAVPNTFLKYFRFFDDPHRLESGSFGEAPKTLSALRAGTPNGRTVFRLRDGRVVEMEIHSHGMLVRRVRYIRDVAGDLVESENVLLADAGVDASTMINTTDLRGAWEHDPFAKDGYCRRNDIRRDDHNIVAFVEACHPDRERAGKDYTELRVTREFRYR